MVFNRIRVIALLDVDCFELQVQAKEQGIPQDDILKRPAYAEVNFIVAVNASAKELGIQRGPSKIPDLGDWNQDHCTVLKVPDKYGKPENLSRKKAGDKIYACIISALRNYANHKTNLYAPYYQPIVEKSNCDEFFVDLTHLVYAKMCEDVNPNFIRRLKGRRQFKVDLQHGMYNPAQCRLSWNQLSYEISRNRQLHALLKGAEIIANVLDNVKEQLGYVISAGVAGNKFLAKIACHRSKPNGLAVLPTRSYFRVQHEMPFTKLTGLGSTSGQIIADNFPNIITIRDFVNAFYPERLWEFMSNINCSPRVFYNKCSRGIDNEPVVRLGFLPKITCGKSLNTYSNNLAFTKDDFIYHLYNRFHEMRDNLLYEFKKSRRIPHSLRLEIFEHSSHRNAKRQLVFSYDMHFWPHNFKNLIAWKAWRTDDLYEWKPILGDFKSEINQQAPFLFFNDGSFIPSLSRIHFIAYFG